MPRARACATAGQSAGLFPVCDARAAEQPVFVAVIGQEVVHLASQIAVFAQGNAGGAIIMGTAQVHTDNAMPQLTSPLVLWIML